VVEYFHSVFFRGRSGCSVIRPLSPLCPTASLLLTSGWNISHEPPTIGRLAPSEFGPLSSFQDQNMISWPSLRSWPMARISRLGQGQLPPVGGRGTFGVGEKSGEKRGFPDRPSVRTEHYMRIMQRERKFINLRSLWVNPPDPKEADCSCSI